jgi:hypothetical protein
MKNFIESAGRDMEVFAPSLLLQKRSIFEGHKSNMMFKS